MIANESAESSNHIRRFQTINIQKNIYYVSWYV